MSDHDVSTNPSARIAIISGFPAVRAGLTVLLGQEPAIEIVPLDQESTFDLLAIDAVVVDHAGLETALDLTRGFAVRPGFVVLGAEPATDWSDLGTGPAALLAGDAGAAELVAAVLAVAQGLIVIDPAIDGFTRLRWNGAPPPLEPADDLLTPREMEVLRLVANGLPNKTIAHQLDISEHTVKFHVGSILTKLDAASRTEAVTIATRRGLLAV